MPPSKEDNVLSQLKILWKTIFQDSDDYIDLFFTRVYQPDNVLFIKHNDIIVSALHIIPYEIKIDRHIYPVAYICGVATMPDFRHKGYMTSLLNEAENICRQRRYKAILLIPASQSLADMYRSLGYELRGQTLAVVSEPCKRFEQGNEGTSEQLQITNYKLRDEGTIRVSTSADFAFFDRLQRQRPAAILHNAADFETIIRYLKLDGGNAFITLINNQPVSIAFVSPQPDNTLLIRDILTEEKHHTEYIINSLMILYNCTSALIHLPPHDTAAAAPTTSSAALIKSLDPNLTNRLSTLHVALMLE
ncbi:MAG: GNAT family N-acetyltransferase [Tannerella sp.]|jgi:predicted acetyltransferase|nr:GNAT family N-acetyltransferase [Tannerella sp.]